MSLTNPEKVITEERLSQFYGSILPYLGGMPEAIANKFSKGDLYSTDEKMIGQWTDGKPLYQKTITFNAVSCAVNTWTTLLSTSAIPTNIASLIDAVVGYVDANHVDSVYAMNCQMYNGLRVWNPATTSFQANIITIRYTKTTDSAISIGSDTDYSTTEKIVGTWIDGKPLYQKTKVYTGVTIQPNAWVKIDNAFASNLDIVPSYDVIVDAGNGDYDLCRHTHSGDMFYILSPADFSNVKVIATLQYTKTTD